MSWDAAPMRTAQGALLGAVAVGHDVTAEHRQHEREACLAAVTHAAAGAPDARGIEGLANHVLTELVAHTRKPVISATLYLRTRRWTCCEGRRLWRRTEWHPCSGAAADPTASLVASADWRCGVLLA